MSSSGGGSNVALAEQVKQKIRRDLSRWSRKLLLCLGLENIGKHIVGDSKWEKLYDGCPTTTSSSGADQEETPTDFEPQTESNTTSKSTTAATTPTTALQVDVMEEDDEEVEQEEQVTPPPDGDAQEEQNDHSAAASPTSDSNNNGPSIVEQEEEVEKEEEEEDGESRHSASPTLPQGSEQAEGERGCSPVPTPPTSEPASEEKTALVDNLFQILPYWYFLNRAFGLSAPGGGEGGGGLTPNADFLVDRESHDADGDEDEDDDVGVDAIGGSAGGASSMIANSSAATQRLNSILILESLRQQLQANGQADGIPPEQTLQQGLHLSELLSRMSGGGDGWMDGGHLPDSQSGQPSLSADQEIDDQPLDLTSSSKSNRDERGGDKVPRFGGDYSTFSADKCRSPFIVDEQTSKVFRSNPRSSKGYTAQELQAALHDIQSGKLGTRRAAVIYGIPRSTLRNKVYKLGKDRGRLFPTAANHHNNGQSSGLSHHHHLNNNNNNTTSNNNNNNNNNNNGGKESSSSMLGKLPYFHGLNSSYLRQVQNSEAYERASQSSASMSNNNIRGGGRFASHTDDEMEDGTGGQLMRNVRHNLHSALSNNGGVEVGRNKLGSSSPPKIPSSSLLTSSSLSQLISKHAHRASHLHNAGLHSTAASSGSLEVGLDDSCSSASDLHQGNVGLLLSGKDWKHALGADQLLNHHHQRHGLLNRVGGDVGASSLRPPHSHQHQQHLSGNDDSSSLSLDLAGKKSRPKRGKYRNYDREALIKAVRAVQNGEMSVHRAGSFFGVPHSTLEYKVKERHLLRRPKRKDVMSPVSQTKSSSPENSSDCGSTARHTGSAHPAASSSSGPLNKGGKPNLLNSGGGDSHHTPHHLFPLAADLRESLSRYLSSEQQERNERGGGGGHGKQDSVSSHHDVGSGSEDDDVAPVVKPPLKRGGDDKRGPAGLEGLIGNHRLSNLFHLNDILLRSSSASEDRGENLLDLSKK